eukprot:jgi/Tetstr1/462772/TSEL_007723.t1
MFLVSSKRGTNKWRLIIDLRELNKWCKTLKMSYETLKHLRQLARAHDSPVQAYPPFSAHHSLAGRAAPIPYMDDFLFLADFRAASLELRARVDTLLDRLDLLRNPNQGVCEPTQAGPHLGLIADLQRGEFRAPKEKLIALAKAARSLMGRAASDKRWLSAR